MGGGPGEEDFDIGLVMLEELGEDVLGLVKGSGLSVVRPRRNLLGT